MPSERESFGEAGRADPCAMRELFGLLRAPGADRRERAARRRDRHRQGRAGARDPPAQPRARRARSSWSTAARSSGSLIESELFGHEKGAFTGAVASAQGAFELAHGGTLFLDEIGELPLDLQPKLLRVLETRRFRRVGGSKEIRVDIRVIAASKRNLQLEVERGKFREDLFFRLAVVPLDLPPLRERREDIPLLARHLLAQDRRRNAAGASPAGAGPRRARRRCARTTGRATCASCATCSSARR